MRVFHLVLAGFVGLGPLPSTACEDDEKSSDTAIEPSTTEEPVEWLESMCCEVRRNQGDAAHQQCVGDIGRAVGRLQDYLGSKDLPVVVSRLPVPSDNAQDGGFELGFEGAELEAIYRPASGAYDLSWQGSELEVNGTPVDIPGMLLIEGQASITSSGRIERHANQAGMDEGAFRIDFPRLHAERLTVVLAGITAYVDDVDFYQATIIGHLGNEKLNLDGARFMADKVELSVVGDLTLSDSELDAWEVNLEMELKPLSEDFRHLLEFASPIASARSDDGVYHFACTGTWSSIECSPLPQPGASAGPASDDSSDAEARREERLERIRQRREERAREQAEAGE